MQGVLLRMSRSLIHKPIGCHRQATDRQLWTDFAVINAEDRIGDTAGGRCLSRQVRCSMGVLGDFSSVRVCYSFPMEVRGRHIFNIVPNGQRYLIRHQPLF